MWHIAFHIFVVTSMNTTAEPNLSVCAAGCIAGILVATAGMSTAIEYCSIHCRCHITISFFCSVATMLAVVVVGTVLIMWRRKYCQWNSKCECFCHSLCVN